MSLLPYLHRVAARESLSPIDARAAMLSILGGEASTAQIAAFLVALRMKGETADELLGFAQAMRERATPVDHGLNGAQLLDTCGTGGSDGPRTFNISTVAAFVVAAAGARVAKHGNRSISGPTGSGSADVLEALGVRVTVDADTAARSIRELGIGFLFAPMLHPAMRFAQPARLELKMRTVFNLLGPLTNPARATAQLIGAPSVATAELMANALTGLQPRCAFVVHGSDGLDEVTTTGSTTVFEVRGSQLRGHRWMPADFGVKQVTVEALSGGDRETNRSIALAILRKERGAKRDIVLVNAAAALVASGTAGTLAHGMCLAADAIDSGRALAKLEALARFTHSTS